MADTSPVILVAGTASVPASYVVPPTQELSPLVCNATFDGTSAAGSFLPTLEIVSDGGVVIARCPVAVQDAIAAGDSAEVTFAPFLRQSRTGAGYVLVENQGTLLPPESTLDFTGAGVTAADDPTNGRTTVTIPGGGGGAFTLPAWQSGCYYTSQIHAMSASSFSGARGNLFAWPIWIPDGAETQAIVTDITVAAGAVVMCVWEDTGSGYPGSLVFSTGSVTASATGRLAAAVTHTFTAGIYWLGINASSNSTGTTSYTGSWQTVAATATLGDYFAGQSVSNYLYPVAFGAPPDPFPSGQHPHTFGAGFFVCLQAA